MFWEAAYNEIPDLPLNPQTILYAFRHMRRVSSSALVFYIRMKETLLFWETWYIFGPDLFPSTRGRQCVKTSTSNDCLLCLAHFKPGGLMPSLCPCQVLGLCDSNSFSHILAGTLMPRVPLSRKFGVCAGVILTGSVISAGPRAEIRSHTPLCLTVMDRVASWPLRTFRTTLKPKTHIKAHN